MQISVQSDTGLVEFGPNDFNEGSSCDDTVIFIRTCKFNFSTMMGTTQTLTIVKNYTT